MAIVNVTLSAITIGLLENLPLKIVKKVRGTSIYYVRFDLGPFGRRLGLERLRFTGNFGGLERHDA